ncbi:glycosyltransferase [Acidobacteria bacterium AH-259-L09]|nr:glycosyltransferase [Acidobacteria bacterium AH-259-L09]
MRKHNFIVENDLNGRPVDLVVAIPSYNEADNIGFVASQVARGLQGYHPHLNTAIINADNFSKDGTKDVFLKAESGRVPKVYLSTPPGVTGKGNNLYNLFTYLSFYRPRVVVVVDADLRSIQPSWPRSLAEPVVNGYDFAAPIYSRNEYDGTITNHLCYPLIYGLLGKKVRQPIGGEFAFSGRLMDHWRTRIWEENVRQYGIDIFMTVEALLGNFRVAQVALGCKIHKPSAPKLGPMFTQVVETLFTRLLQSKDQWSGNFSQSDIPPIYGCVQPVTEPQGLSIDYKRMKRQAIGEFASSKSLILRILPHQRGRRVKQMFEAQRLRLSSSLWMSIVYDFLCAYDRSKNRAEKLEILEALKPLYLARVVSFIRETLEFNHVESENKILRQGEIFRSHRQALIRKLTLQSAKSTGS